MTGAGVVQEGSVDYVVGIFTAEGRCLAQVRPEQELQALETARRVGWVPAYRIEFGADGFPGDRREYAPGWGTA